MSCVIEIENIAQNIQTCNAMVSEPVNRQAREEMEFSNKSTHNNNQNLANDNTQQNTLPKESKTVLNPIDEKQKCVSIDTVDETEKASLPFKNISKQTQNQFENMLNYKKSSNVVTQYLVFKEINVNSKSIQQISQVINKSGEHEQFTFSNYNDYSLTSKQVMLKSILDSINYSKISEPEQFKKNFIESDYYTALSIIAEKFQSLFRWNVFFLILQQLLIQISFIFGVIEFYIYDEDNGLKEQVIIYSFIAITMLTEIFLIKRSKQFLEKEGNDYPFIIAALVQAIFGLIAVSFATVSTPASVQTGAYLIFLLSYMMYILYLSINVLPKFEFFKETFSQFIYSYSK